MKGNLAARNHTEGQVAASRAVAGMSSETILREVPKQAHVQ